MKINAFLRLIQTIACGVAVLGASHAYGQADDTSGTTFGTLQPADENGDSIEGTAGEATSQATESGQTLTQSPAQSIGDPSGLPTYSQPLYPPGVEIPLTETEIPGSAYFVGPDGERIDASTLLNQVPPIQEQIIPSQGAPQEFSSGATFSPEGVYDGTLSFPMGTFPTTPFGERILSEVPSSGSSIGEIPGALVGGEGSGSKTMPESPGTENGVPLDQIVRPGDMPTAKEMTKPSGEKSAAGAVAEATEDPGEAPGELEAPQAAKDTRRVVNNGADPAGSKTKKRDGRESVGAEQLTKRQARVKQALKEALAEKTRLGGLLKKANLKTEGLMKEINQLKSSESKMKEETQKELASLKKSLMKSRADSQKLANSLNAKLKAVQGEKTKLAAELKSASAGAKEKTAMQLKKMASKLKMVEAEKAKLSEEMKLASEGTNKETKTQITQLEGKLKEADTFQKETLKKMKASERETKKKLRSLNAAKNAAVKKAKMAQDELTETKKQMEAKLANAEASVAEAKKKVARAEAKVASAMNDAREAKSEVQAMAKKMAAAMAAPIAGDMAGKTPADNSGIAAKAGSDSKAAAELEVKRRLEAAEKAKKAAEAAEDAEAKKNAKKEDKDESVLSLDDQIKRLKMQRDQQIAESETRIRAKQQREIDELIKKGKAIDSDEVKAAVGKMKNAIKTSEEKLRSRFLRRLERLKEDMKGQ